MDVDFVHRLLQAVETMARQAGPDPWNRALAVGTFLTFLATAYMAWQTALVANDTLDASILADIHHQESQSGLVIWSGRRHIDFNDEGIFISGFLKNVGAGAATSIMISIRGNDPTPRNIGVFLPSLAAGEEYPPSDVRGDLLWVFRIMPSQDRDEILNGATVFIEYLTIFERRRVTRYPVSGRSGANSNASLDYIQELIDLNRDDRVVSLSNRRTAGHHMTFASLFKRRP